MMPDVTYLHSDAAKHGHKMCLFPVRLRDSPKHMPQTVPCMQGLTVVGVDPNPEMASYALQAAEDASLSPGQLQPPPPPGWNS